MQISAIVNQWRDAGIVVDSDSPYASPVLLVNKKNGDSRLVVDFRRLNAQTRKPCFFIPTIRTVCKVVRYLRLWT